MIIMSHFSYVFTRCLLPLFVVLLIIFFFLGSLAELNRRIGGDSSLPMNRFRPNIVVKGNNNNNNNVVIVIIV